MKSRLEEIIDAIGMEHRYAKSKFPTWPLDPLHAIAIVGEEFGELTRDVLQSVYEREPTNQEVKKIRTEAIQTIVTLIRFLEAIDLYRFHPSEQTSADPYATREEEQSFRDKMLSYLDQEILNQPGKRFAYGMAPEFYEAMEKLGAEKPLVAQHGSAGLRSALDRQRTKREFVEGVIRLLSTENSGKFTTEPALNSTDLVLLEDGKVRGRISQKGENGYRFAETG